MHRSFPLSAPSGTGSPLPDSFRKLRDAGERGAPRYAESDSCLIGSILEVFACGGRCIFEGTVFCCCKPLRVGNIH